MPQKQSQPMKLVIVVAVVVASLFVASQMGLLNFFGVQGVRTLNPILTGDVPSDHVAILNDCQIYVMFQGVRYDLQPIIAYVHTEPNGQDKTVIFFERGGVPEAVLQVNTWKQVADGEWGRHSLELSRMGWSEVHFTYQNITVVLPEVSDPNGLKVGYWSSPIY